MIVVKDEVDLSTLFIVEDAFADVETMKQSVVVIKNIA